MAISAGAHRLILAPAYTVPTLLVTSTSFFWLHARTRTFCAFVLSTVQTRLVLNVICIHITPLLACIPTMHWNNSKVHVDSVSEVEIKACQAHRQQPLRELSIEQIDKFHLLVSYILSVQYLHPKSTRDSTAGQRQWNSLFRTKCLKHMSPNIMMYQTSDCLIPFMTKRRIVLFFLFFRFLFTTNCETLCYMY